ncbi:MAG: phosphoribosyltransferase family protein [Candidatus Paceibacterota bacterium]
MHNKLFRTIIRFLFPKPPLVEELEDLSVERFRERLGDTPYTPQHFIACTSYKNPCSKAVVWQVKYKGNRSLTTLCGQLLHEELFRIVEDTISFNRGERILLVPIPASKERKQERGWNQAELLCQTMLSAGGEHIAEYRPTLLKRVRHTERQTKLPREKRLSNVRNSMEANPNDIPNGSIVVLIDDVATTGSTFKEAVRALTEAGVWRVHCLAFAH